MATSDDVKKLAALARIEIGETEREKFSKEFEGILAYIGQLEQLSISIDKKGAAPTIRNVFREDGTPHEPGVYTEMLAEQFPERDGNYLKVKQIISHE